MELRHAQFDTNYASPITFSMKNNYSDRNVFIAYYFNQ